jgi:hypothetical protein
MNTEKKSNGLIVAVIAVIVIIAIVWISRSSRNGPAGPYENASTSASVAVSETTKVSGSLSEYQNAELGFSVKYPSNWEKSEMNSGVSFDITIDSSQVSTVNNIKASIIISSGTCVFPPVTTVKDRNTMKAGDMSYDMLSMSNTVQGRTYFNRMYSMQKENVCYMFSLSSVTLPPSSKKLTGSQATQATNNNKAIVNTADAAFTDMVKSFAFVIGPQGVDETKAPVPTK